MSRRRLAALLALIGALALMTPLRDQLEGLVDSGGSSGEQQDHGSRSSSARAGQLGQTTVGSTPQGPRAAGSGAATGGASGEPEVEAGPAAPFAGDPLPSLTSDEKQTARRLVAQDARLKTLVKGERLIERELVPWGTIVGQKEGERKVGATFVLRLRRPTALSGQWPLIKYGQTRDAPKVYTIHPYYLRFRHVSEVMVNVDLGGRKVVSIAPGEGARIVHVPAALRPPKGSGEGD